MSKTITIRLSDQEYKQIAHFAKKERRPISNFIVHSLFNSIANMFTVDEKEMKEILSDKELMKDLEIAHQQALQGKGRIVE